MREEEKKAIYMLETFIINHKFYNIKQSDGLEDNIKIALNLIENQQKELNNIKEIEQSHKEENGKLRVEYEKVYEDNLTLVDELKLEKEKNELFVVSGNSINLERHIKNNYISKDKIKKFIKEELPEEEICKSCDIYDVNGVSLKEKLEKILEV